MSETVLVHVRVREECLEAFIEATRENARCSRQEPGVLRFDVLQGTEDPCRFVLVECYRDREAPAAHKATAHYARWRETVEPMMAEPRKGTWYREIPVSGDRP